MENNKLPCPPAGTARKHEDPMTVLRTEDLCIGYHSKKNQSLIAENINLELKKGELIGLVGINGSGKSTLLRSLSGLQKILDGNIFLGGQKIQQIPPEKLSRQLSVVLTGQGISKNLSVQELVALGRQPYTNWLGILSDQDRELIHKALSLTQLNELKTRKCHTLSDGQLQRALIARALAQETPVILLDEPTTHLDLHHKASILTLLRKITKETDSCILFSTHDIELVLPLCDQMIVLHQKKALMDSPENLIKKGVFSRLFPEEQVGFDAETKRFYLRE